MRRREFAGLLSWSAGVWAQEGVDREESWRQYLEWSAGRRGRNLPNQDYRDELMSRGVPIDEVDRRVQMLENRLLSRPDAWKQYFNRAYREEVPAFEPGPNSLLAEVVRDLEPGVALDVAMGQGRNAIYLARRGWDVSGFDVSDVGLAVARAKAARAGVRLRTALASYGSFGYGTERWDLILMAYPFTPLSERLASRIVRSLKPGGVLIYEHLLATDQSGRLVALGAVGMPRPGQLADAFGALTIERDEVVVKAPDWGPLEPSPVAQLVARKP